jgi:hypothetical protein
MADSTSTPDNLGPNQTRVLDSVNHNFESVVYQRKKPPLSCEVNLTGNLASQHSQQVFEAMSASGWRVVGSIRDNQPESILRVGDLACSNQYPSNTVRLIANDRGNESDSLIAWLNGERVLVQGSNSLTDQNNTIELASPHQSGTRVDFIFLEMWRKLVQTEDPIYKYGNKDYGGSDNFPNDLIDPSIGIETSLRIQVQYRIRVVSGVNIETYPDGFDPDSVFVQGPLNNPLSTCDHAYFSPVPGDPGLWRGGVGDTAAQDQLQTVDGFTYAIPMFAINRHNSEPYDPENSANGAGKSLADYLAGIPSDRPDDKYNDWIVADDVLDLRHRISPVENAKEIGEKAFQELLTGKLRTKMGVSIVGEDRYGPTLIEIDGVTSNTGGWFNLIAIPDSTAVRRVFSNAAVSQPDNIVSRTVFQKTGFDDITGSPWIPGDEIQLSTVAGYYPTGTTITAINDAYVNQGTSTIGFLNSDGVTALVGSVRTYIPTPAVFSNSGNPGDQSSGTAGPTWIDESLNITPLYNESLNGVIWGPNSFIGVGSTGGIYISNAQGTAWTDSTSVVVPLNAVAYDGTSTVVAVGGNAPTDGTVFYSSDIGVTWATATLDFPSSGNFKTIAWSSTAVSYSFVTGVFVAAGEGGMAYWSTDGISWHETNTGGDNVKSVIWNSNIGKFVAVGDNGSVRTSIDGNSWGSVIFPDPVVIGPINYTNVAYGNGYFLLGADSSAVYTTDFISGGTCLNAPNLITSVTWVNNIKNKSTGKFLVTADTSTVAVTADDFFTNFDFESPFIIPNNVALASSAWGKSIKIRDLGTDTVKIELETVNNFDSSSLFFDYTIAYSNGAGLGYGFSHLPDEMLAIRKESSGSPYIATRDSDIPVRTTTPVRIGNSTKLSMLSYRGASPVEPYNFGHQMIYDTTGINSAVVNFPTTLYGYPIIGVADAVSIYNGMRTNRGIVNVTRTPTNYSVQLDIAIPPTTFIELNLYTGLKFFDTNKQGRAILDSYEMIEVTPIEPAGSGRTTFTIDTGTKPIIAIASNRPLNGRGFSYVNDIYTPLQTNNVSLPTDTTKARAVIEFSTAPLIGDTIKVPVLVNSPIESGIGNGYLFFYRTIPYQGYENGRGWLDSSSYSPIEAEGPSIIATAGSGNISNYTVTDGVASFSTYTSSVSGIGTSWLSSVKVGDLIYADSFSSEQYRVTQVSSDTILQINTTPSFSSLDYEPYHIVREDQPASNQSNVIDRLPALSSTNDGMGANDLISTNVGLPTQVLETRIISRTQDILGRYFEDVEIGVEPADRGRIGVNITGDNLIGAGNLGLMFEPLQHDATYQKTYQTYVVNKDGNGELYLMVVGSETHNTDTTTMLNPSAYDSVDMFRMPGRPLTLRRPA